MSEQLAPVLMIQGTRSSVGKSLIVTALCRIFARRGVRVAPFKAQNMALNSFATPHGDEIGRAQAVQAEAAGIAPHVDMNPVLLKPEGAGRIHVVLDGRPHTHLQAGTVYALKHELWPHVTAALDRLRARYDLVIAEGAGSPAEINLKAGDIVNMQVAQYADAPVLIVGDIERGGVFASLVGTMVLLEPAERALVRGFIINKFRGDTRLLGDGLEMLRERAYDIPTLGVVPFLPDLRIAAEDSVTLEQSGSTPTRGIEITIIRLPHISNFDEFDALAAETGVSVRYVDRATDISTPAAVVLPGSKATIADLHWLRQRGLAEHIRQLEAAGTPVVGICGGYQMLGERLIDEHGVESAERECAGLGLLPVVTRFATDKATHQVRVQTSPGSPFPTLTDLVGYEIHMGRSDGGRPVFQLVRSDGTRRADGAWREKVWGTYVHGLFDNRSFRRAWLRSLGWTSTAAGPDAGWRDAEYDRLADHVDAHLDVDTIDKLLFGTV